MAPQDSKKPSLTPWEALGLVWDLGLQIALPTVAFTLGGRWLDRRYDTSPLFILLGLGLALAVVAVLVVRQGKDIAKRL